MRCINVVPGLRSLRRREPAGANRSPASERAEREFERETRELKMENDFLKKAAAICQRTVTAKFESSGCAG